MGSFSGVKRGSKRSWVETERCLSCDLFNDGEGNGDNDYDHLMFGGGGGKVLFQDDDDDDEEEEEVEVDEDGGGDDMDYGNNDQDHHTNNDNDHGYDDKGMEQRCSVCTETKKKRTYDLNIRTDTNNNSNQHLHCTCYQNKERDHYSSCPSSNFNITNKKYENLNENFRNYDENKFEIVGKIEESTTANDNYNNKSRNRRNERHSSLFHTKQLLCLKSRKLRVNSALMKNKYKPFNKKIENITDIKNKEKDGKGDGNNNDNNKNNNSNVYKLGNNKYSRELN